MFGDMLHEAKFTRFAPRVPRFLLRNLLVATTAKVGTRVIMRGS